MTDPTTPEQEAAERGYTSEQAALIGGLERLLADVPVHVAIPILLMTVEIMARELGTVPARFTVAADLRAAAARLEDIARLGKENAP